MFRPKQKKNYLITLIKKPDKNNKKGFQFFSGLWQAVVIVVVLKGGSDMTKIVSITMAIIIMLTVGVRKSATDSCFFGKCKIFFPHK